MTIGRVTPTFAQFKRFVSSRYPGREWKYADTGLRMLGTSPVPPTSTRVAGYLAKSGALTIEYLEAFLYPWRFVNQYCETFEELDLP